ncbi:MAG: phosphatidate cytidylyltransferase [Bacteroidales bacterium]|nr:phosphatidate cytidylyltransferase [Bacteroidales bacterium]
MNSTVKRSIFGVLFLAVMLGGLLFYETLYVILFAFITGVMLYEFYKMTMGNSWKDLQAAAIAIGVAFFLLANEDFFCGHKAWRVGFAILCVLALMVKSILRKDHTDFLKTGFLYAGLVYIALPLALSNAVVCRNGEFSGLLMMAFFCIIWASDVGAYCFGMLLGQKSWSKKLCPTISPKKSWAGFWGGLLTALLAGAILYWTGLLTFPIWHCLIMAALMNVMGVFGDLFESLWKRAAGVKDSGNIIPGHGGLMDRFDSALFAIPTGYIYLLLLHLV